MLPQWRLRLDLPKPQSLCALSSKSKAGLIRVNFDDIPLTAPISPQHCTHSTSNPHSVHLPHVLRGNMYSHGQYVGTKWDSGRERVGPKLCGLCADNWLLGCGDYVDFVPIKLPYIVCSAEILVYRAYKILNFCGPWPPMS